jgi:hypothetical protein
MAPRARSLRQRSGNCAQNANSPLGKMLRIDLASVPQNGVAVPFASPCLGPVPGRRGVPRSTRAGRRRVGAGRRRDLGTPPPGEKPLSPS